MQQLKHSVGAFFYKSEFHFYDTKCLTTLTLLPYNYLISFLTHIVEVDIVCLESTKALLNIVHY